MTAQMPRSGEGCLGSRGRPSDTRLSSGLFSWSIQIGWPLFWVSAIIWFSNKIIKFDNK